jgi:hypothetical protein
MTSPATPSEAHGTADLSAPTEATPAVVPADAVPAGSAPEGVVASAPPPPVATAVTTAAVAPSAAAAASTATGAEAKAGRRIGRPAEIRRPLVIIGQLLIAGLVAGYVVATLISFVMGSLPVLGGSDESPTARAFMVGIIEEDPEALFDLQPKRGVFERAMDLKGGGGAITDFKPIALRFLGSDSAGQAQVQMYAVQFHSESAGDVVVSYAITLIGGQVVRVE